MRAQLHAEGDGAAYIVIANLFALDEGHRAGALGKPHVADQMIPPAEEALEFTYTLQDLPHHAALLQALPHQVELEVGFYNMFGERIVFTHTCRVGEEGLKITNWPHFTWPWEFAGGAG